MQLPGGRGVSRRNLYRDCFCSLQNLLKAVKVAVIGIALLRAGVNFDLRLCVGCVVENQNEQTEDERSFHGFGSGIHVTRAYGMVPIK